MTARLSRLNGDTTWLMELPTQDASRSFNLVRSSETVMLILAIQSL